MSGTTKPYLQMLAFVAIIFNLHFFMIKQMGFPFGKPDIFIHGFLLAISFAGLYFLFKNVERVQNFMNRFFLFTVIKMLVSVVVIAGFIVTYGKDNGKQFAVSFVILYLLYTAMESMLLIKKFKSIASDLSTKSK